MPPQTLRLPYSQVFSTLAHILQHRHAMLPDRAQLCATLFANASRDGIPSHGLNRFTLLCQWIAAGSVLPNAPLTRLSAFAAIERWDGGFGPGQWNAAQSMSRALDLARAHGIGCVALRNTNHWLRAGNYGWQAADAGFVGICFTNTIPLMPAWGATSKKRALGNSPLVIAVPRANGNHVVLDMAMAQYSMGKLALFQQAGQQTPLPAGFDTQGNQTHDPAAILNGGSAMPIGHWKGAGLAMLLDLLAASLANGNASHQIHAQNNERGVSQTFLALNPQALGNETERSHIVESIIQNIQSENAPYPGARSLAARRESQHLGIAVDEQVWQKILELSPPV